MNSRQPFTADDFRVVSAVEIDYVPGYRMHDPQYSEVHFVYVLFGTVNGRLNGRRFQLKPGQMLALFPGSDIELTCNDPDGYSCLSLLLHTAQSWVLSMSPSLITPDGRLVELLDTIRSEVGQPGPHHESLIRSWLHTVTLEVKRLIDARPQQNTPAGTPPHAGEVQAFRELIERELEANASVMELARSINLGYSQLSRYFQQLVGTTPKSYQIRQRVMRAQQLLLSSPATVAQIAARLGFPSSQHFATIFRKYTRMTPTEYRRQTH